MISKTINSKFFHHNFRFLFCLSLTILLPSTALAIGEPSYVSTVGGNKFFTLSASGKSSPLFINSNDFPGVIRALKDLQSDIDKSDQPKT